MSERYAPEDPREWLNRARSNLALARMQGEGVYLEDLCFNTQQVAEKAIKALLIQCHVQFPYVHDIAELLTVLEETGQEIPQAIRKAERLTRFAVFTRYPGIAPPISREEYTEALHVAESSDGWRICYGASPSRARCPERSGLVEKCQPVEHSQTGRVRVA